MLELGRYHPIGHSEVYGNVQLILCESLRNGGECATRAPIPPQDLLVRCGVEFPCASLLMPYSLPLPAGGGVAGDDQDEIKGSRQRAPSCSCRSSIRAIAYRLWGKVSRVGGGEAFFGTQIAIISNPARYIHSTGLIG
jgi:hypothetical protein